jgi:hypothetical protein
MQKASGSGKIAAGLAGLLVACGIAMPVHAEDLTEIFNASRQSDPKYRAARYEFEAASFVEPQARAALLPLISAEYLRTRTDQNILSSNNAVFASGRSQYTTESQTMSLTQPIFKLSAWRGYQQAKVKVRQAAAVFSAAEQDLMLRVATAYLNALAARDALGFAAGLLRLQTCMTQGRDSQSRKPMSSLHATTWTTSCRHCARSPAKPTTASSRCATRSCSTCPSRTTWTTGSRARSSKTCFLKLGAWR